ncbi:hypothetical protein SBA5_30094 [Candidatus Sulfotelmatomonas gaucii]|uniref:Uncharacterized protein n=1 Tax=Candidatus Sulfuritelmatomonas gaucii TaxID=2043161 RepID=A0A2N9LC66_9BACT|nr:hypothetical protein SBA5_30094 [Candidatus Sulfotelmatomonas gaucii]
MGYAALQLPHPFALFANGWDTRPPEPYYAPQPQHSLAPPFTAGKANAKPIAVPQERCSTAARRGFSPVTSPTAPSAC